VDKKFSGARTPFMAGIPSEVDVVEIWDGATQEQHEAPGENYGRNSLYTWRYATFKSYDFLKSHERLRKGRGWRCLHRVPDAWLLGSSPATQKPSAMTHFAPHGSSRIKGVDIDQNARRDFRITNDRPPKCGILRPVRCAVMAELWGIKPFREEFRVHILCIP